MDKDQVLEIATRYFELVSKELKPRKVLLFGSYARGNWHEFSDIDIAIVVDSIDGDFLDMASMLYRLRRDIDDRIKPVLIEEGTDSSGFLEEITKYAKVLHDIGGS